MDNIINFELLTNPVNWVIVFLILFFGAQMTRFVLTSLGKEGISL